MNTRSTPSKCSTPTPPRPAIQSKPRANFLRSCLVVALATIFSLSIVHGGIPALRHDWSWPADTNAFVQWMLDLSTGWMPQGLGQPQPYPMTYFVAWPLAAVAKLIGPPSALVILLGMVATSILYAGSRLARAFTTNAILEVTLGLFLLLNPWTYNKLVAGHVTQILAYAGVAILSAELLGRPERTRVTLAIILTALQLQFFIFALAVCLLRIRNADVRGAVCIGLVVFAPTIIGIGFGAEQLRSWIITIPWEQYQSVPPQLGVILLGYFTQYAAPAFTTFGFGGMLIFVALSTLGAVAQPSRTLPAIAVATGTLIVSAGTLGPLQALWRWSIVHVPEVGVFRELYDLIAFLAIAYAILTAAAVARYPRLRIMALVGSFCLTIAWIQHPPTRLWIAQNTISTRSSQFPIAYRYAVMPPFQPQAFRAAGSGFDQLFVGTSAANAPLNAILPRFPADAALASYALDGDVGPMRRLGVATIECRDDFIQAFQSLARDPATASMRCPRESIAIDRPAPIFALEGEPERCSLCQEAGNGNIFAPDDDHDRTQNKRMTFSQTATQREFVTPGEGWIDLRLVFNQMPRLAQAFGGAYTTQSRRGLAVPNGASYVLAQTRGALRAANGDSLVENTGGYRWIRLPEGIEELHCFGSCAVVGFGNPSGVPLEARAPEFTALQARTYNAWLSVVALPAGRRGILRYLESYDAHWMAVSLPDTRILEHTRLDATINGWRVPYRSSSRRIVLFNALAIVQLVAGTIGAALAYLHIATFVAKAGRSFRHGVS